MDVFDLSASLKLDSSDYEKGLQKAKNSAGSFSSILKKAGAGAAIAVGAAATTIGVLTKKSIDAYSNYEQLSGGIKKLYQGASDELMQYANAAYKTSGMSANQYMEQATSFSAALVNSLDGDYSKAAKQTDVAMRAISDNFNTFGGDIEGVKNAFQGFAKQNYTMLDNLKLGYGGTKSEMERLIADANEYAKANGMAADLSIDSFSDIVTAIDLIQQKQGIAGTTAKEAATTIEGAFNMTKAAWDNLVTGLANPDADLGSLIDDLIVSIVGENEGEGLLNQVIPAVQRAIDGIGQLLEASAPLISDEFPKIIGSFLPPLISAASTLVSGLVAALPKILQALFSTAPTIIDQLSRAIIGALPVLAAAAPQIILTLADGISKSLPELIPVMIQAIDQMITALLNNMDLLVEAGIELALAIVSGIAKGIPQVVKMIPNIVGALFRALVKSGGRMASAGSTLIRNFGSGIAKGFTGVLSKVGSYAKRIPSRIKSGLGNLRSIGSNLIEGLWNGIKSRFDSTINHVKALASKLPKAVKKVLGIASPSKVFMEIGQNITRGLSQGIEDGTSLVDRASKAMTAATIKSPESGSGLFGGREISIYNNMVVNGAENPEDFAHRFMGELELEVRSL